MGKKHEGETKEEKEARKAAKAAKKAAKSKGADPPPAPVPEPEPAPEPKREKKEKKAKKEKADDGSGRIAELALQVDDLERDVAALKPGGSAKSVNSALGKILTQMDGLEVPAGSPARQDKRSLQMRVEKLQNRATAAVKKVEVESSDEEDEPPARSTKRGGRTQAPARRVRKPPPPNETQDEKIARIVEERVLDALEGRDAQIRMLKDQIRYIKKNGNKMMERKAQLKNMGGSGDRFTNMSSDGAIPTGY